MTIPKPNGDVLRKIEQVKDDCSREFSQRNFASAYYIDEQTKEFLAELEKNHESVVFTERGAKASFFALRQYFETTQARKWGNNTGSH
ncbi:hypothetical protein ACKWOW_00170 [Escherichia coli]|uniref:hypothetical protein n=1 Tax=Escherichia coli TaxID=562 RepID=UPI00390470A5